MYSLNTIPKNKLDLVYSNAKSSKFAKVDPNKINYLKKIYNKNHIVLIPNSHHHHY